MSTGATEKSLHWTWFVDTSVLLTCRFVQRISSLRQIPCWGTCTYWDRVLQRMRRRQSSIIRLLLNKVCSLSVCMIVCFISPTPGYTHTHTHTHPPQVTHELTCHWLTAILTVKGWRHRRQKPLSITLKPANQVRHL